MTTREMVAHLMAECLTDAARMVRAEAPATDPTVVIDGACRIATALFHARWQAGAFHVGDRDGAGDRGFGFHVGWCFVTVKGIGPRVADVPGLEKRHRGPIERCYGIRFNDGAVWIEWAHDQWNSHKPAGRRTWRDYDLYGRTPTGGWTWSWSWKDALLGKPVYSTTTIQGPGRVWVCLPEGRYNGIAHIERATWRRARWPWSTSVLRLVLEVPGGIPVPGKGENSWDVGDDASYGVTMPMRPNETLLQAVARYARECILHDRQRYASLAWRPSEAWAKEAWEKAGATR